jgi:class 3 adenylate cyclase
MDHSASIELLDPYMPGLIKQRLALDPTPIAEPVIEKTQAAALMADVSGFTRLTEQLAERGPVGMEELTRVLNDYWGKLIELITVNGGDVIKFAGDALYAIWAVEPEDLAAAVRRAALCGLAAQERLDDYPATPQVRLSMKISIGVGDVTTMHVGGIFRRWEFLMTGSAILQMSEAETRTQTGEVVLSPEAWDLIRAEASGTAADAEFWRLEALTSIAPEPLVTPDLIASADLAAAMLAYIPAAIRDRLEAGQTEWLAELRRVTVLFINVTGLDYLAGDVLEKTQFFMRTMQGILYHYEGSVNKLLVDDKGTSLIVALGLPPLTHEDDGCRWYGWSGRRVLDRVPGCGCVGGSERSRGWRSSGCGSRATYWPETATWPGWRRRPGCARLQAPGFVVRVAGCRCGRSARFPDGGGRRIRKYRLPRSGRRPIGHTGSITHRADASLAEP